MNVAASLIPLQKIFDSQLEPFGVHLYVLRVDLIHPTINGNKWFKLKYNLQEATKQNKNKLLTFGGAYSNHIAATAAAGKEFGFETIGIIRGEEELTLNPTLQLAKANGMRLKFVSRENYRQKNNTDFIESLKLEFNDFYLLPEGGTNDLAIKGCSEILSFITIPFDYVCCAVGTGGTFAGIISSLDRSQQALGFQVLKGEKYLEREVEELVIKNNIYTFNNWEINDQYHVGGYAKVNEPLFDLMTMFKQQHKISLDYVYNGKMLFGIYDLIKEGYFKQHSTIIAINTGGLQGNAKLSF